MPRTGLVRHPTFIEHNMGIMHPESPQRLTVLYHMLDGPDMSGRFENIAPRPAAREEIERVHSPAYFDEIKETEGRRVYLDPDTSTSPKSYEAALLAAGGTMNAVDAVMEGRVSNAFCLHRPPGHHAETSQAMGFCIFNNVAIGAEHALQRSDVKRVMIYDPDLHHGNGTQHAFYHRKDVLYMSTHQYPYYPGTGAIEEVGQGEGEGFTVNVPLSRGFGDGDFARIMDEVLIPVGREFRPDLLMCSAGADIHEEDPLGSMKVTGRGFGNIIERMLCLAGEVCGGRLVVVLEGGYNLRGLSDSVKAALNVMAEEPAKREHLSPSPLRETVLQETLNRVRLTHSRYWRCFQAPKPAGVATDSVIASTESVGAATGREQI